MDMVFFFYRNSTREKKDQFYKFDFSKTNVLQALILHVYPIIERLFLSGIQL